MKKILLLVCHSSDRSGGGEDDFVRILKYLHKDYTIYSAFPTGEREVIYSEYSDKVFHVPNKFFPLIGINCRYFISRHFFINFFKTVFNMKKFISKNKDIDLAVLNSSVCFIEALVLSFYRIPYIIFIREKINPDFLRKNIYKLFYKKAVKIFTVSNYLKNVLINDLGSFSKVEVLNAPIDEDYYESVKKRFKTTKKLARKNFIITQVGSISYLKGQDIIIDAMNNLMNANKLIEENITIRFIGKYQNDTYFKTLENLYIDFPAKWNIEFKGELNKEDLIKNVLESDCIIISSREEGASLVFSEGLFLEIPVIVSNVADLSSMVDNHTNGLIYDVNDYKTLSTYIFDVLTDIELREKFINNSMKTYYFYFNLTENMEKLGYTVKNILNNRN